MNKRKHGMEGEPARNRRTATRQSGFQNTICIFTLALVTGCASYGKIENSVLPDPAPETSYSVSTHSKADRNNELSLIVAFSGGGTRAAAMAYGVMQELRDTQIMVNGQPRRLLDEIDTISSVSGGSFTSAYYGLHGDGMFDSFEQKFLRYDLDKHLTYRLMNPVLWFGKKGRTEMAIEYYQKLIFDDATFADLMKPGRPLIVINSSDLAMGVRFSFTQEYFNLLCSDLTSFSVARAVAASSAVPVLFNPVVVENYPGCESKQLATLHSASQRYKGKSELEMVAKGLESYADKKQRKYIHFVDGGITDNTGLRAIYDVIGLKGGPATYFKTSGRTVPRQFAIISVNASTERIPDMGLSTKEPSIFDAMDAVTNVQLHRYDGDTLGLLEQSMHTWSEEMAAEGQTVTPYFIPVSFEGIKEPELRYFLNKIPTSFSLSDEQVDRLIKSGRELLRNNPVFQQLLKDLNSQADLKPENQY